jgi:uncharacterized protein
VINPEEHKKLSLSRRKEFKKLSLQLKKWPIRKLDETVHELHYKAFEIINCLECAPCCRSLGPRISDMDIRKLAKALNLKPSEIFEKYLRIDEDGDMVFKTMPCPFLNDDNYCRVYQHRPKACREYPHTNMVKFSRIIDLSLKNINTCPAVYQIFDELSKIDKK